MRRYAPEFLDVLKLRAAPTAKVVLDAIEVLRGMTDAGIDRRCYELCAKRNSPRSTAWRRPTTCPTR